MLANVSWRVLWSFFALVVIVGTSIAGGVMSYSSIPFWDTWDGQLNFYLRVNGGDWTAWFEQHNEHRIILSRILFWLDLTFFGGKSWFLVVVNYSLVAVNAVLFYRIVRTIFSDRKSNNFKVVIGLFISAWIFQWMQNQNLIWAFQSQFFLVQTFSLASFYVLSQAINPMRKNSNKYFIASCFLGFISAWTMANGLAVLPMMLIFLISCRQSLVRLSILASLSVATCLLYFWGYKTPDQHSAALTTFIVDPLGMIQYASLYLGGPFYYLAGRGEFGKLLAYVFGFSLFPILLHFTYSFIRDFKDKHSQLSLCFYVAFVFLSALITAGGRLKFGVDQALESRYTTPALMAWAAILIIAVSKLKSLNNDFFKSKVFLICISFMTCVMCTGQLTALKPPYELLHERNLAALTLAMGIQDQKRVSRIYPSVDKALDISKRAYENDISIFSSLPYRDFRERLAGFSGSQKEIPECVGFLDGIEDIDGVSDNLFIKGWIFKRDDETYPDYLRFLNSSGEVVGYAVTGGYRPDVAGQVAKSALLSGFDGYILSSMSGSTLIAQGGNLSCQIKFKIPRKIFLSYKSPLSLLDGLVGAKSIKSSTQWLGSDFYKSAAIGIRVYGSYINGDADTGSVLIKVKPGQKIFYRSGPVGGRQFLEVNGDASSIIKMPTSLDWTVLDFSGLPENQGGTWLKFIDDGSSWGEWSAIGLREER